MKKKKDAIQKDTVRRLLVYLRPYALQIIAMLLCAAVTVGFTLYAPVLIGQGVDQIAGADQVNFDRLWQILLYLTATVAVSQAFVHLEQVPIGYVDQNQPGDILSRIVTDVGQFSDGLLMGFTQLFTGVASILGTIGFMISINGKIALLVILLTPVSLFVASLSPAVPFICSRFSRKNAPI